MVLSRKKHVAKQRVCIKDIMVNDSEDAVIPRSG